MALREELDNYNAEIVVGPEDDPQVTNAQLAVEEWNRTTVADGAWLQQNAIGPLSARDIVLANAIDDTNDALAELSGKMADVDGRSLKSINGRFFSGGSEIWQGSDPAIVPDGTGVKNDEVIYVPQNDGVILSMNDGVTVTSAPGMMNVAMLLTHVPPVTGTSLPVVVFTVILFNQ
jgi:hypothetical protein